MEASLKALLTYAADPKRSDEEIPLWFSTDAKEWQLPEDYEPTAKPHFKVTLTIDEPSHGGYCSGAGAEDDIDICTFTLCKDFPTDTWDLSDFEDMTTFTLPGGFKCWTSGHGSGACSDRICTKITLSSVERCD